jgi:hypothetical protein
MKIPSHYYAWSRKGSENMSNDHKSSAQGWWLTAIFAGDDGGKFDIEYVPSKTYGGSKDGFDAEALSALLTHALIGEYVAIKGLCILVKRNPAKFGEYQATAEALVEAYESKRVKK